MKIWCQLPMSLPLVTFKPYYDLLQSDYDLVKRPDTETQIKDVPTGLSNPNLFPYLGLRQAQDREVLKSMLRAEREGFDAIAGACVCDPAIKAAANLMDIPVVGPFETSVYLARMMGIRLAVVTTHVPNLQELEYRIKEMDTIPFAISHQPVRSLSLEEEKFFGCCLGTDYTPAIENFNQIARGCIQDGADVLIVGCGLLSPMLTVTNVKDIDGVPIIDPMLVSLKVAEMLVDFRAAGIPIISSKGLFMKATKEDIEEGCKALGLIE